MRVHGAMRFVSRQDDLTADILVGRRSVWSARAELEALRLQCGQPDDALTSPDWFLAHAWRSDDVAVAVVLRRDDQPFGAMLLRGRKAFGVPSGLLKAGLSCGRGAVIGAPGQHAAIAEMATQRLLAKGLAHTVMVTMLLEDGESWELAGIRRGAEGSWVVGTARSRLSLAGGFDAVLSQLSYKARRNVRYYRRRAEMDLGCVFISQLSPEQSRQAIGTLHGCGRHAMTAARALNYAATVEGQEGGFAMGLQDGQGRWLSYLSGWRRPDATYFEWQLNSDDTDAVSISPVMRSCFIEHEAARGTPSVVFVGGTSPNWSRAFVPQRCGEMIALRQDPVSVLVRRVGQRLRPDGRFTALLTAERDRGDRPPDEG